MLEIEFDPERHCQKRDTNFNRNGQKVDKKKELDTNIGMMTSV